MRAIMADNVTCEHRRQLAIVIAGSTRIVHAELGDTANICGYPVETVSLETGDRIAREYEDSIAFRKCR